MAYNRRNDENGRVVGFRDGQPVYKKAGRGGKDDRSERRGPHRQDGARPEGGRKFDERGERPFGNTYNKKEQGGQERGERGRREQYGNRGGARPDQRDGYERSDRPYRGRSFGNGGREGAQRFENEKFRTKAEEFEQIRPPRREKYSDNFKPLPQDIREVRLTSMGQMRELTPKMSKMFIVLLPMMLPMANPGLPFAQANTLTIISGREVPKATMVKPMMSGDSLARMPTLVAPLTSQLAPKIRATKPTMSNNKGIKEVI